MQQFDLFKFPKLIPLCEAITLIAFREALSANDLFSAGPPSERPHQSAWDHQLLECCRQTGSDPNESQFAELLKHSVGIPLMPTLRHFDQLCRTQAMALMTHRGELEDNHVEPTPEQLEAVRQTWPSAWRELHELAASRQQRLKTEWRMLKSAERRWYRAASKGEFVVTGRRIGVADAKRATVDQSEFIDPDKNDVYKIDLWGNRLERRTLHRLGRPDEKPAYDAVCCKRRRFLQWLRSECWSEPQSPPPVPPGATEHVRPPADQLTDVSIRRKPGRRSKYKETWETILKPLAIEIYAEIGPYDRAADALQSNHIDRIIEQFKRDHKGKKCPSKSWFKPKLREIQPELDERIK